jgi:hypothetical protein
VKNQLIGCYPHTSEPPYFIDFIKVSILVKNHLKTYVLVISTGEKPFNDFSYDQYW